MNTKNNYGHWLSGPVVEAFAHPKPSVKDHYIICFSTYIIPQSKEIIRFEENFAWYVNTKLYNFFKECHSDYRFLVF
jgi:hypothetical protein